MKRTLIGTVGGAMIVASMSVVACTDSGRMTGPVRDGSASTQGLIGDLLGTATSLLIPPVERTTPLSSDVKWSFTAGPGGAISRNTATGLTISIPAGALSTSRTITVTALAGSPVAYKFEPHGLVFSKNVVLTQSLIGTSVESDLLPILSGAYFATDRLELSAGGLAVVTEIISALTNPLNKTVRFPITHFSGYIVASGRSGVSSEGY